MSEMEQSSSENRKVAQDVTRHESTEALDGSRAIIAQPLDAVRAPRVSVAEFLVGTIEAPALASPRPSARPSGDDNDAVIPPVRPSDRPFDRPSVHPSVCKSKIQVQTPK